MAGLAPDDKRVPDGLKYDEDDDWDEMAEGETERSPLLPLNTSNDGVGNTLVKGSWLIKVGREFALFIKPSNFLLVFWLSVLASGSVTITSGFNNPSLSSSSCRNMKIY